MIQDQHGLVTLGWIHVSLLFRFPTGLSSAGRERGAWSGAGGGEFTGGAGVEQAAPSGWIPPSGAVSAATHTAGEIQAWFKFGSLPKASDPLRVGRWA